MNRIFKKHSILSLVLALVLIAAMALTFVSCDNGTDASQSDTQTTAVTTAEVNDSSDTGSDTSDTTDDSVVGVGNTSFTFNVKFKDGSTKSYTVKTDKTTVGAALVDAGLISGSDSQYGLMVDTVCGETLVYTTDKMYWAFYVNGEYAMSGVDSTDIKADETYSFEATAG